MIHIAVCDDEKYVCSDMENLLLEYSKKRKVKIEVEIFYTGEDLTKYLKNGNQFDLIFLDIELKTTTGIAVGTKIRNELDDHIVKIVFITSKNGYEKELFDVQPFNFLPKPIDEVKFEKCMDLAVKLLEQDNNYFEYKKGYDIYKLRIKEILFFEKELKKIKVVTENGEDCFYDTLENVYNRLPDNFVAPHGSFLVNFDKIICSAKEYVTMTNGQQIPVSQRNLKKIREMLIFSERKKKNGRI